MQLIAFQPSAMFRSLQWLAASAGIASGVWLLAAMPALPAVWAGALLAAGGAVLALRVSPPDCRLRLHREGFCLWFEGHAPVPGEKGVEMAASGAFVGAGWMVVRLHVRQVSARWFQRRASRILVLAPDAGRAEDLRQLRVWLRLAAPRAVLNSGAR
jgi:hypothetical protein